MLAVWASADLRESRRAKVLGVLVYLGLALGIAWLSRDALNPDLVAYAQIARHYARGALELAVSSWWSPMFSWLIVPGIRVGADPVVWAQGLQILAGLGLAAVTSALVREWRGPAGTLAAFHLALLAALVIQAGLVNPDLCQGLVLTAYLIGSLRWLKRGGIGVAFATGALGGIAYLTKSYSLPYVVAHLTLTAVLRVCPAFRAAFGRLLVEWVVGLAGIALFAAPWIAVLSRHDHEFTINCAGKYWTITQPLEADVVPPCYVLHSVRAGRVTTIENMRELPVTWEKAPPFGGRIRDRVRVVFQNTRLVLEAFDALDGVGLVKALLLLSVFALFPLRGTLADPARLRLLWGLGSVALYGGGYLLVFFTERYLWCLWGLVIALLFVAPEVMGRRLFPAATRGLGGEGAGGSSTWQRWQRAIPLVVALVLLVSGAAGLFRQSFSRTARLNHDLRRVAGQLSPGQKLASPDWFAGLYLAYWNQGVFLGQVRGQTPEAVADELKPFGRVTLLLVQQPEFVQRLAASPHFRKLDPVDPIITAMEFIPPATVAR